MQNMKKSLLMLAVLLSVNIVKAQLGPNKGDAYQISTDGGGTPNNVMHKTWLYRNSAGSDWYTASIHDGVAIDNSFFTPGTDTRAWWERNPLTGEQRWGNSGQTWLTLADAKLGIGTTSPTAPLQITSLGGESRPGGINAASATALKLSRPGTQSYSYPESAEFRVAHGSPTVWGSQLDLYLNGASNQTDMPDQQVMTWLYNGHVGIGRTDPGANLHIQNLVGSKPGGVNAPTIPILRMGRVGSASYSYSESAEFRIGHGGSNVWGSQLDLYINGGTNQNETPDQQAMTWQYNGNVGIGLGNPNAKLEVNGAVKFGGDQANLDKAGNPPAYQALSGSGKLLIGYNRTAGDGETDFVANEGNGNGGGFAFYSFNNSSQEKQLLRMLGNGNMGIGINNPAERLSVNGNIRSKEVKVEAENWPDYVFMPNYQLPTLTQIEEQIKLNGHLQDMPSAKDVELNGIALGEMNKLLLKKVEELTLHLIEKEKEIVQGKINDKVQQMQLECLIKDVALLKKTIKP